MDFDGDFDIAYGDGTPESLADALADPPSDSWQAAHSPWDAVRASWESMWPPDPRPTAAESDDTAGTAAPSQTADEERT